MWKLNTFMIDAKKRELSLQFKLDSIHEINKFREKKVLENPVDQLLANCFLPTVLVEIRPNWLSFNMKMKDKTQQTQWECYQDPTLHQNWE